MKIKKLLLVVSLTFTGFFSFEQTPPGIQWQKSLGGTDNDQAQSLQQTVDGGYIIAGSSRSIDGDVTGNHGASDCWITKLNSNGTIQWQKSLGGSIDDDASSIQQTTDGGFIVSGITNSNDGDVSGLHGQVASLLDVWVIKLDATGNIQWQKCLGGSDEDAAGSAQQTKDGGYIMAGSTSSSDGDVTGYHTPPPNAPYPYSDCWVIKLGHDGTIFWQKTLGGSGNDAASSIQQTNDGGFIIAGQTTSTDGDVTGYHTPLPNILYSAADYWVVKLDSLGNIVWQRSLGGSGDDEANSIRQTTDGGYIVAGYTNSTDGDVTGYHSIIQSPMDQSAPPLDFWIVKLDSSGNIKWQKCLGGSGEDIAQSIQQTFDGSYIITGYSNSNDGDVSGHHGTVITSSDMWVVKIDSTGNLLWQKSLGGSNNDYGRSIQQSNDGGYILAGYSISDDGDVTGHHGINLNNDKYDYWIVKLSPDGILPITLLNFTATKKDQSVVLTWQTATEINTNFFDIERSFDGMHFNKIGKVSAAGNSNIIQNYNYTDDSLSGNTEVYYRLQAIDIDGNGSYSKIEKVTFRTLDITFAVYPNPSKSIIYVTTKDITMVTIADNSGRVVINKNITGDGKTSINIAGLAKGGYLVSAKNYNGIIQKTIKLIVE